jgi:lysophospholipase L1-like esterase
VALGDSITDGAVTTINANHRWPDFLARRLQANPSLRHLGVLNKGIGGNRLLHNGNTLPGTPFAGIGPLFGDSALARFDRDVAAQPGARYVIVLLGINDIGHPTSVAPPAEAVSVQEMIFGYRQLIARAHERGLRIYGATMTPFQNTTIAGYYNAANEAKRLAVNRWIRTSGEWDGVIDFDRAVRDPNQPLRMLPAYDSGDHLHPNDAGMRAMADAIPLRLFRHDTRPAAVGLAS